MGADEPGSPDHHYPHRPHPISLIGSSVTQRVRDAGTASSTRRAPSSTRPSAPIMLPTTVAPAPTTPITSDRSTQAPASTAAPGRITESMIRALAGDAGAGTDDAVLDQGRGVDVGRVVDRRAVVEPANTAQQVEVGRQVQLRTTGVDPVVVRGDAVRARRRRRPSGTRRARSTIARPGGISVEHRRFEHVGARTDQVARLGSRRRLLDERPDGADAVVQSTAMSTTPKLDGSSTAIRWIVASAARRRCVATRCDTSRSVSTSPLATMNVSSMPAASAAKRIAPAVSSGSGSTA